MSSSLHVERWSRMVVVVSLGTALAAVTACGTQRDEPFDAPPPEPATPAATQGEREIEPVRTPALQDYLQFAGVIEGGTQPPRSGIEHEYTADGLRKLAAALESLDADQPDDARRTAAGRIRDRADDIQRDPTALTHARAVREAFMTAAETLDSSAPRLRDRAAAVSPDVPLLQQQDEVRAFFEESARAMQRLSRGA